MISMPDSTSVATLPAGYPAYLGYVDGNWPTAQALVKQFPGKWYELLTVTGATLDANGVDCEPGNVNAAGAADWAKRKLAADSGSRPIIYASVIGEPGYGMPNVLTELAVRGIHRSQVRLHTAHYGAGEHVCGPETCKLTSTPADGTQWTNAARGLNGTTIDMSVLNDGYFGTVSSVTDIPLNIVGMYTDGSGALYAVGTNHAGVLCESKRTAFGVWSAPYQIAGKTGA